jgi:hypothetical protein
MRSFVKPAKSEVNLTFIVKVRNTGDKPLESLTCILNNTNDVSHASPLGSNESAMLKVKLTQSKEWCFGEPDRSIMCTLRFSTASEQDDPKMETRSLTLL